MSHKYTCIAIDDDPMSLKIVQSLIEDTEFLDLKGLFQKPSEALSAIDMVDLIFLDIEMPGMTGLELLSSLKNIPQVIIISRKSDYALESFEYEVTDYLQKPLTPPRFLKAVLKAKRNLESSPSAPNRESDNLFIKVDSVLTNFELEEIEWIQAYGDYVKIRTGLKLNTVYSTMKNIESKLPIDTFVRVHRSYIVNIHKIQNIDVTNLQIGEKIIPIGSNYKAQLMARIKVL